MFRRFSLGLLSLAFIAMGCKGADGATGPAGPQGPQGPAGAAGTPHVFTATISGGAAIAAFPAAAGTNPLSPPATTCFISSNPSAGSWLAVTESSGSEVCGIVFTSGHWSGSIFGVPNGWTAAWIVVY